MVPLYLSFPDQCDIPKCEEEKEDLRKSIQKLEKAFGKLNLEEEPRGCVPYGSFGSRVHLGLEFADAKCLNCESKDHTTDACLMPPIIRLKK